MSISFHLDAVIDAYAKDPDLASDKIYLSYDGSAYECSHCFDYLWQWIKDFLFDDKICTICHIFHQVAALYFSERVRCDGYSIEDRDAVGKRQARMGFVVALINANHEDFLRYAADDTKELYDRFIDDSDLLLQRADGSSPLKKTEEQRDLFKARYEDQLLARVESDEKRAEQKQRIVKKLHQKIFKDRDVERAELVQSAPVQVSPEGELVGILAQLINERREMRLENDELQEQLSLRSDPEGDT
jgi:hypothetical protein